MWAADGRLRLRRATCVQCGHRFGDYEAWLAHRREGCQGALMGGDATIYREVQDAVLEHLAGLNPAEMDALLKLVLDTETGESV